MYAYVSSPDFQILLMTYSIDDGDRVLVDLAGEIEPMPPWLLPALLDRNVQKVIFNATFERLCLMKHFGTYLSPEGWYCTSVKALQHGLTGKLETAIEVLRLPIEAQKDTSGANLIKYFSKPCKPTKVNGGRTRNLPFHDPVKWEMYRQYNVQDVAAETALDARLIMEPVNLFDINMYWVDQRINDLGVGIDMELVESALYLDSIYSAEMIEETKAITYLDNPNSGVQLKGWLSSRGIDVSAGINKDTREDIFQQIAASGDEEALRVIEINIETTKASLKKYEAMKRYAVWHGEQIGWRAHHTFRFYGANRTGRFAGSGIQLQNMTKNYFKTDEEMDVARAMVRSRDYTGLRHKYGSVADILSQLLRTALIPTPGYEYHIADYSAIEARILAWVSKEQWRIDVFNSHGKIYEASASRMFGIPLEEVTKGSDARGKGKIAELAFGYGGSVGAAKNMDKGGSIPEEDLPGLVKDWRAASPMIVKFWGDVERAAMDAIRSRKVTILNRNIVVSHELGYLQIKLPSGRKLMYYRARIEGKNKWNKDQIMYEGNTSNGWRRNETTYGASLVENIVQAIARDCLCVALAKLDFYGYRIPIHVHDEIVSEVPIQGGTTLEQMCDIMAEPIPWAPGLYLPAEGYTSDYYKKD